MKSEIRKMTKSEYLKEQGWICVTDEDGCEVWRLAGHALPYGDEFLIKGAFLFQRARDAAEERAAWDQFAAAILSTATDADVAELGVSGIAATCSQFADALLDQRRARFAVEIVEETEDKPEEASRV